MKLFYSIKLVILSIMMCCPELVMAQVTRPLTRQEIDAVLNPSLLEGAEKSYSLKKPLSISVK